jgi:hypothetical protein
MLRLTIPLLYPRLLETQIIPIERDRWLVGFPDVKSDMMRFVEMVHCVFWMCMWVVLSMGVGVRRD